MRVSPDLSEVIVCTPAELAGADASVVGYACGNVHDPSQPDGTSRKLMAAGLINRAGWWARTGLKVRQRSANAEFMAEHVA